MWKIKRNINNRRQWRRYFFPLPLQVETEKELTQAGLEKTVNEKTVYEEKIKKKEEDIVELQKQVKRPCDL